MDQKRRGSVGDFYSSVQCFDIVGWATGRASSLLDKLGRSPTLTDSRNEDWLNDNWSKKFDNKAALMPDMDGSVVFTRWCQCDPL